MNGDGQRIITITEDGDIVLRITHQHGFIETVNSFRVSSRLLQRSSNYFGRLLQPGRFEEAAYVEETHLRLRENYRIIQDAPAAELPILKIQDLGRLSAVKAVDALLTDLFLILSGRDAALSPVTVNFANLAIVADRFDALDAVRTYFKRKKLIHAIDGKTTAKLDAGLSEEKVRQRLLVGLLLDYPPWVERYSARLILRGWVGKEAPTSAALWRDLPYCVENELAYRRDCILDTVQSVQSHFLTLYTSKDRQCRLGYDNSPQCDSFQLGEMVRFFMRVGTVHVQGLFVDAKEPAPAYDNDVSTLLDLLRQVPEYQIDKFHTHCGIRTRMTPMLDLISLCLQYVGICAECWHNARREHAWVDAKRPLLWKRADLNLRDQKCSTTHASIRAMFMASERLWT